MRSSRFLRRVALAVTVPAALAVGLLAATPAAAVTASTTTTAPTPAGSCAVTEAQLVWGVKESFRSYISGSIARGEWTVVGGATYQTPVFTWTGGAGEVDPAASTGEVAFSGGIRFTGHGGLLDTTIASPTLVMTGPGTAQLRVDLTGVSMDSALAGDTTPTTVAQVPLVDIDLAGATVTDGPDVVTIAATDAATTLTADGAAAFGSYEAGDAFDPITLSVSAACAPPTPTATVAPTPETGDAAPTEAAVPVSASGDDGTATIVAIVAGVLVVAGVVTTVVVMRRRKAAGAGPSTPADREP